MKIPESVNVLYDDQPLLEEKCSDPIKLFSEWMEEAIKKVANANAMALATCQSNKQPKNRIVLLKEYENNQFIFFSNYQSDKATDLLDNPNAALLFFWDTLQKQIRIEGNVKKLDKSKSDEYFLSRPRGSQIGALASNQSSIIASRKTIEEKFTSIAKRFEKKDIVPPPHWGGYVLSAEYFEFWKGRADRLHDRLCFRKSFTNKKAEWKMHRLSP